MPGKLLVSKRYSKMPEILITPESEGSRLSEALVGENIPVFLVIDHGMSLKAAEEVSEVTHELFSLSVEEKVHLTKDVCMSSLMDLINGFSDNKDFKSAPTGFYRKGDDVAHFQKIKWVKCSKSGRVENIAPGRITRLRKRRNKKDKDDEDDGEGNRRPSDSHVISLILRIVIILMLFLIVLSLIVWVMR